jgi:hypothetical protein
MEFWRLTKEYLEQVTTADVSSMQLQDSKKKLSIRSKY